MANFNFDIIFRQSVSVPIYKILTGITTNVNIVFVYLGFEI